MVAVASAAPALPVGMLPDPSYAAVVRPIDMSAHDADAHARSTAANPRATRLLVWLLVPKALESIAFLLFGPVADHVFRSSRRRSVRANIVRPVRTPGG
jgi:hypothetical protein